jgi:hypothetical protein
MKNFVKAFLLVVVFTSFTATSFSGPAKTAVPVKQKSVQSSSFEMQLSNTSTDLVVTYINPESQQLLVKVMDIFGNVLETAVVVEINGRVLFNLAALEAKGGTGTYTVSMTDGDGGSAKKGTIVIIKE